MTDADFAAFANDAFALRQDVERRFCELGDEHARLLNCLVQTEVAAAGAGVDLAYGFLAAMLAEHVADLDLKPSTTIPEPTRDFDDLPF